jgi:hypothetical protein
VRKQCDVVRVVENVTRLRAQHQRTDRLTHPMCAQTHRVEEMAQPALAATQFGVALLKNPLLLIRSSFL